MKTLEKYAAAFALAATTITTPAAAQLRTPYSDGDRYYNTTHDNPYYPQQTERRGNNCTERTVGGAVLGGVLGSIFGKRGDKRETAVVGGVAGGVLGAVTCDRNKNNNDRYRQPESRISIEGMQCDVYDRGRTAICPDGRRFTRD